MDRISGLFHPPINGVYWGYNPLILTIDPNFLGHPSISGKHAVRFKEWVVPWFKSLVFFVIKEWVNLVFIHLGRVDVCKII